MDFRKNKGRIAQLSRNVVFLAGLGFLCVCLNYIFIKKDNASKYHTFYEQREDFDVLFFGTSHVEDGVFPMELWKDYGITSYNLGGSGNSVPTNYWILVNALDYANPDLVVVDVANVSFDVKINSISWQQVCMDQFPLSMNKVRAMYDLFDDKEALDKDGVLCYERRWEMLFPFMAYHSRWTDLHRSDFRRKGNSSQKGAKYKIRVAEPAKRPMISEDEVLEKETLGLVYLRKIIELCQSRDIDVLLTFLPFPAMPERQKGANSTSKIAKEYGVHYIDFVRMGNVVDYTTDLFDSTSHLNPSGARKVTRYLGEYIATHYDVPDRRKDEQYRQWDKDYDTYVNYKIKYLKKQDSIEKYLMLLSDEGFESCVYVRKDSPILEDERLVKLLHNISPYEVSELRPAGDGYLSIGDDKGTSLDGWNEEEGQKEPDMRVVVEDKYSGETIDQTSWYAGASGIEKK